MRVLLVDDDLDATDLLQILLARHGFDVNVAHSVTSALDCAAQHSFDVLVSDLALPDGTGHELLGRLYSTRPLPAIALSGYTDAGRTEPIGTTVFAEYLPKPTDLNRLVDAIHRALGEAAG